MEKTPSSKTWINDLPKHDLDLDKLEETNKKTLEFIEDVTSNAYEVQRRVLTEILTANAKVEYLSIHGLGGGEGEIDCETFKKVFPIITYEDLIPYVERIANGDRSPILCVQPISEFLVSSGTTRGVSKLIPSTKEEHERRVNFLSLLMPVINQFVPGLEMGKKMFTGCIKLESTTPCGIPTRTALTSIIKNEIFKNRPMDPYAKSTTPVETILCLDSHQSMYSQLLCGLFQNKEVLRVGSSFAPAFIRAIKFLQDHWKDFCHDIRTGSVNSIITEPNVRESVMRILKPDSVLADYIENECKRDSWKGIIARLWPNAKYIEVIVSGSMSVYVPTLDYYSNGLPLVSSLYLSSECWFGLNLEPFCKPSDIVYTFIPTMAYFEFLPLDKEGEEGEQELVDLVDVKLGKEYEVVVTTYSGLYRYCVGDIVRVAGYKNKTPQFNIVGRKNVVLSIDVDKTDEEDLQNAIKNATSTLLATFGASLQDYTSYADTSTIPGHYVIFWEISYPDVDNSTKISTIDMENCCLKIEESLNSVYRQCRASDMSIGPLEIRIVEKGTFSKLMDYAISHGASMSQYKTPRCIKDGPIFELLNSRVISRYFSPKSPEWSSRS